MMDFRILHNLKALYHPKVHHIGNESECLFVILQGMAVGFGKDAVFLESRECMFNLYSDSALLGVLDFLGTSKFFMISGAFMRNDGSEEREVLLDSLIPRVSIETRLLGNDLGKDGLLEEPIVMHPARDGLAYVDDIPFSGGRNLGLYGESLLLA